MPTVNLPVHYHQQDNGTSCGPACLQMVIESLGAATLDQTVVFDEIRSIMTTEKTLWHSSPFGLTAVMQAKKPTGTPGAYALLAETSATAVLRKAIWSIHAHHLPAVLLVGGMAHWIVVSGFQCSDFPASPDDNSYTLQTLDVLSPTLTRDPPPPPHNSSDLCGTGGAHGLANRNEDVAYLLNDLFPVGNAASEWHGKFITIADASPAVMPTAIAPTPIPVSTFAAHPDASPNATLVDPESIRMLTIQALEQTQLSLRSDWKQHLANTIPGKPILVKRIDNPDHYYYLVPMQRGGAIPVAVRMDAIRGRYEGAGRVIDPEGNIFAGCNLDSKFIHQIERELHKYAASVGFKSYMKRSLNAPPQLVWRPCRESSSPYLPFFQLENGGQTLFVRIDGSIFSELHDLRA